MARLVWLESGLPKEINLPARGFVTVGSGLDNGLVLNDRAVNRHHARLVAGPHGFLIKDLHSDQGLRVNNQAVTSCFLKDGDRIQVGGQELEYRDDRPLAPNSAIDQRFYPASLANALPAQSEPEPEPELPTFEAPRLDTGQRGFLRYLDGPGQGRVLNLDRPLIPLGNPAGCHAAISCRTQGLILLNLGRDQFPLLNGEPVRGAGLALRDGDQIQVGLDLIEVRLFNSTDG